MEERGEHQEEQHDILPEVSMNLLEEACEDDDMSQDGDLEQAENSRWRRRLRRAQS